MDQQFLIKEKKKLQDQVFKEEFTDEDHSKSRFAVLDDLNLKIIKEIIYSSNFAEYHINFYLTRLISKTIRGKSSKSIPKITLTNTMRFMDASSKLDKRLVTGCLPDLNLSRSLFERIINVFTKCTEKYKSLVEKASILHNKKSQAQVIEYSKILVKIKDIENIVEARSQNELYSGLTQIELLLSQYKLERSTLIKPYMRIPFSIATKYGKEHEVFMRNFQEGCIGLLKAVTFYKPTKLSNFGAYSKLWVRKQIIDAHHYNNLISFPANAWASYSKVKPLLEEGLTLFEIEKKLGFSHKKLLQVIEDSERNQKVVSLSSEIIEDNSEKIGAHNREITVEDMCAETSEKDRLEQKELREKLERILSVLSERERTLLCLSCGAMDYTEVKFTKLEMVREILRQGFSKIFLSLK